MTEPVTSAAELAGYRDQRIAGALSQDAYLAHVDRLGPLIAEGKSSAPTSTPQAEARAQIHKLTEQRQAGTISQADFLSQMDKLGPQAHPDSSERTLADGSKVTVDASVAAELDRAFSAPDSPAAYRFDYGHDAPETPEAIAWDTEVRKTFHAAGLPQSIATLANSTAVALQEAFLRSFERG
jgi:hypothetical protein